MTAILTATPVNEPEFSRSAVNNRNAGTLEFKGSGALADWSLRIIEEIKPAHFVRTVVRTVSSADTAVISHYVESVLAVNGRVDRANGFTWRILAMLTGHRLENHLRMLRPVAMVLI